MKFFKELFLHSRKCKVESVKLKGKSDSAQVRNKWPERPFESLSFSISLLHFVFSLLPYVHAVVMELVDILALEASGATHESSNLSHGTISFDEVLI